MCLVRRGIKIQWLRGIPHGMTTFPLFLLQLLAFSHSAPEPDTHLHVYLPPEGGQGNYFFCEFRENSGTIFIFPVSSVYEVTQRNIQHVFPIVMMF